MWTLLWAVLTLSAAAETVDRVVVVVGEQLVLDSDLQLETALRRLDRPALPFWRVPAPPLRRLTDAAIIRQLAGDVGVYQPSEAQVTQRLEAVRARAIDRAHWEAFLTGWGHSEESLRIELRGRMVVERYLERNVQQDPTDEDAWLRAVDALLARARPRLYIREVPEHGSTP